VAAPHQKDFGNAGDLGAVADASGNEVASDSADAVRELTDWMAAVAAAALIN
jgi:hypothetical protein